MASPVKKPKKSKETKRAPQPILDAKMSRPNGSDLYIWCDYIELLCLVDKDRRLSRDRVHELLDDTAQMYGEQTDADVVNSSVAPNLPDDGANDPDALDDLPPDGGQIASHNEMRIAGWFQNLEFRAQIFGDAYPFKLSADRQELERESMDTPLRLLYVQMLMSASLRLVPRKRHMELTQSFEETSYEIFKQLMPKGWEVHRFGAQSASRYHGLLFNRLTALAKDLRGELNLQANDFNSKGQGDYGLDLVAWHPMAGDEHDRRDRLPIAFAQCGCTSKGDEWSMKSLEASPAKLKPQLGLSTSWSTYYFMPHDLTEASGSEIVWQQRRHLTESIVIDRSRLLRLAKFYDSVDRCMTAQDTVTEAVHLAY